MCKKKEKIGFTDCHLFSKTADILEKNKKNDDDDRTEGAHKKNLKYTICMFSWSLVVVPEILVKHNDFKKSLSSNYLQFVDFRRRRKFKWILHIDTFEQCIRNLCKATLLEDF